MSLPNTGASWVERDQDLSLEPFHSLEAAGLVLFAEPFEDRPFDKADPMDDVVILLGGLVRRRVALRLAMELGEPDLVENVISDQHVFDVSPDGRGKLFDTWEGVIPPEILTDVLLEHGATITLEEEDAFLEEAA